MNDHKCIRSHSKAGSHQTQPLQKPQLLNLRTFNRTPPRNNIASSYITRPFHYHHLQKPILQTRRNHFNFFIRRETSFIPLNLSTMSDHGQNPATSNKAKEGKGLNKDTDVNTTEILPCYECGHSNFSTEPSTDECMYDKCEYHRKDCEQCVKLQEAIAEGNYAEHWVCCQAECRNQNAIGDSKCTKCKQANCSQCDQPVIVHLIGEWIAKTSI